MAEEDLGKSVGGADAPSLRANHDADAARINADRVDRGKPPYTHRVLVSDTPESIKTYGSSPGGKHIFSQHMSEAAAAKGAATARGYGHTGVTVEPIGANSAAAPTRIEDVPVGTHVRVGNGGVDYVVVQHSASGNQVQIKRAETKNKNTRGGWYSPKELTRQAPEAERGLTPAAKKYLEQIRAGKTPGLTYGPYEQLRKAGLITGTQDRYRLT